MDIFVSSISRYWYSCIILHKIKLFHIKIRKISFCHNSSDKVNNPHPPKCHTDVKCGNLSMDVTSLGLINGMAFAIPWLGCKLPSSIPMLMLILKRLKTVTKTSIVISVPLFLGLIKSKS